MRKLAQWRRDWQPSGPLLQDFRLAVRVLWKSRAFALIAIVVLGLGIGATTTVYSTVKAMVLRPLAVPELDRILTINETLTRSGWGGSVAPANYRDLAEQNTVFEKVAAFQGRGWDANVSGEGMPDRLEGYLVTPGFFQLLGMAPLMGRSFVESDAAEADSREAVISYASWMKHFGGDPRIVGRDFVLNGVHTAIIGIMPREFDFPIGAEIWGVLPMNSSEMHSRNDHTLQVIGRLQRGASIAEARAELNTIAASLERQYPSTNADRGFSVGLLRKEVIGETRQYILILMWSAGFLLVLACANVANLQLARAMGKQKELLVRIALGASRWRIARQVLTESTLLAVGGGLIGLLMTTWAVPLTRAWVPPFIVQHIAGIKYLRVDGNVLAFTATVALLSGIVAGVIPALQAGSFANLQQGLKEGVRGMSAVQVRGRSRSFLVITEVALALILLVGAGVMVKGFRNLVNRYPGYEAPAVLSFRVTLPEKNYPDARSRADFYARVTEKLAALPGAESAAAVTFLPSGWAWQNGSFNIEDAPPRPGEERRAGMQAVTPDFFRVLRIPLYSGRLISGQDGIDALPIAVINETTAQRYWPRGDPIGHRIRFRAGDPWRTVVGVVGEIRQNTFDEEFRPTAYFPMAQTPPQSAGFVVRCSHDPMALAAAARAAIQSVDRQQPAFDIRTLQQLISDNASGVQYSSDMMLAFALIALLLAAAGIYAVMAYAVVQRTHEIGIRMALGAQHGDVLRMIVGNSVKLAAGGLIIGVPAAFMLMRLLASLLSGVVRLDVPVLTALAAMLAVVAALAGFLPARRATQVDPIAALRSE